jgi:dihydrolipoamide dehydrogenase
MSTIIEVKVPDIGDFKDVQIIEILVAPGDRIEPETSWSRSRATRPAWRFHRPRPES